MYGDWFKPGAWNAICDICGLRFKSDQLRKNWKSEMVCRGCFEMRHPQEFIRVRPEKIAAPWVRPEGADQFQFVCFLWGQSAYADLGEADCMRADYTPQSFLQLYQLKWGAPYPFVNAEAQASAIPGYAIPGKAIPGVTFTGVPF